MSGPSLRAPLSVPIAPAELEPFFAGHFPGRPILPGVAHLALVERALRGALDAPVRISSVASLRLRRPVGPGDELTLSLPPSESTGARFAILCGGQRASDGVVGIVDERGARAAAVATPEMRPPLGTDDPAALLPHAPPARFVDAVLAVGEGRLEARAVLPEASPFAAGGVAPALVALELGAQAAAALEAIERTARGEPRGVRQGYLVGARAVRFDPPRLPVGAALRVTVQLEARALPLCRYRFEVAIGASTAAVGTISTYLAGD